jgi:hypothetical protein
MFIPYKLLFHAYEPFSKEVQKWLETNTEHKNWNTLANFHHLLDQTLPKLFHFYLSTKMNNFYYYFHHLKLVFIEVIIS